MITIDYRDSRAIYEQVKESFKSMIISGVMVEHEQLPSVREISAKLSINPNTIQRAYRELEVEQYIYTVKGKGSFVAPKKAVDMKKIDKLKKKLIEAARELLYLGIKKSEILKLIEEERT